MAGIYRCDIWCDDCIESIKNEHFDADTDRAKFSNHKEWEVVYGLDDEYNYDSDDYPKYCSDDEESDSPQHCAAGADCCDPAETSDGEKYGYFFGNPLTTYGEEYVAGLVDADRHAGRDDSVACEIWAEYYDFIDFG